MADLITDLKLIILLLTFILTTKWVFETTDKSSWVVAIIVATVMTYLIFQHEELAVFAFVFFFLIPNFIKPFLEGVGWKLSP